MRSSSQVGYHTLVKAFSPAADTVVRRSRYCGATSFVKIQIGMVHYPGRDCSVQEQLLGCPRKNGVNPTGQSSQYITASIARLSVYSSKIDIVKRFSITLIVLLVAAITPCSPVSYGGSGNSTPVAPSMTASPTSAAASASLTVPFSGDDPNDILWTPDRNVVPELVCGRLGASILGPQNIPVALQNADSMGPPTTDNGDV